MSVTAEMKGYSQDSKGNIVVEIEYTLPNNSKVIGNYHARYENFIGKTDAEMQQWLAKQVKYQCDRYLEAEGARLAINTNIIANKLDSMIGQTLTKNSVKWFLTNRNRLVTPYLDTSNYADGEIVIKEIEVFTDGTYTEIDV